MAETFPLRQFWPRASDAVIAGVIAAWPAVQAKYGFNTPLRCAHFWGQITWECSGGTELREDGHYSAAGILKNFGVGVHSAKVTPAEAEELTEKCKTDGGQALFNRVYGIGNPKMAAELGNVGLNDGWLFRGAGALSATGRAAFGRVGKAIGKDLVGNPDLANDPAIALWMGAEEYTELKCQQFADADDTHTETVHINGGTNGLADRAALIKRWLAYFEANGVSEAVPNLPMTAPAKIPTPVGPVVVQLPAQLPKPSLPTALVAVPFLAAPALPFSAHTLIELAGISAILLMAFVMTKKWST